MPDTQTQTPVASPTPAPAPMPPASPEPPKQSFFRGNKMYIIAILIGAAIIGILAFVTVKKPGGVKEAKVTFAFDAPSQIPSGTEQIVKIKVENRDQAKLVDTTVEVVFPDGVTFLSSTPKPKNVSGTLYEIKELATGQNAVIILKVKAEGSIGDSKKFGAKLTYQLSNFSSEFTKDINHTAQIVASGVAMDLQGPTNTTNTQLVSYTLRVKNHSDDDFKNARVQFTYPDGFDFAEGSPTPDIAKNIWTIKNLPKGKEQVITIQGSYRSVGPGESRTMKAEFQVVDSKSQYYTQADIKFVTALGSQPLLAEIGIPGADGETTVDPGNSLTFQVRYQNNAAVAARGVNIIASLDSRAIDYSTIQAEGAQINNNSISWNASSLYHLESVNPNESGTVRFTVQVKNPPVRDSSKNLTITATVKIKSNEYDSFQPGNTMTLKVTSIASMKSSLDYVTGSLPPKVGKQTTYRATLTLRNLTNDFANGVVTAFIPLDPNSFDPSSVTAEEQSKMTFDPSTGKLTWQLGNLPAHTGDFAKPRTVSFNIKLTPAVADEGQQVLLLKDIKYVGTDTFTSKEINMSANDLTSGSLPENLSSQGSVQR